MTKEFTTLVGVKWTFESIQNIHKKMFAKFLKQIQQQNKFTEQEKVKRIKQQLVWFTHIEQLCLSKQLAIKKA